MEEFKIRIFEMENSGIMFPKFAPLSSHECHEVFKIISKKFDNNKIEDGLDLILMIRKCSYIIIDNINSYDGFNFFQTINSITKISNNEIFLNWHHFDEIDKMNIMDFTNHFDYIWYEGPDDIEVIDMDMTWIASITHFGQMLFISF
ncbi:MAG: hypothetical protein KDE22_00430 [Rhodobacterales bacterium]|nr:hypothetical protein [Rhodobacterales bacterium]